MKQPLFEKLLKSRKTKGISQQESTSIVGKYDWEEATLVPNILNRIVQAPDLTTEFLMSGNMEDKSAEAISDEGLLSLSREIEKLPEDKKKLFKELHNSFIFNADIQKQIAF